MSLSAPVLAGETLPQVTKDGYRETIEWRGGYVEMASGTMARDLLSTTPKRVFALTWTGITTDAADTIISAFGAIVTADNTFLSPYGDSYTVQPADARGIDVQHYAVANETRVDVNVRLRET